MVKALRIFITFTPMYILIPMGSSLLQTLRKVHVSATSSAIRKLFTLAVYAVASTVSMEAMYWGYWTSEVVGGLMMYTLGLYFFFKIRRAHEAEAAAPASTGARYSRKYVFCDNGCSAPHDKLQVIAAAPPSEEAGSVCAPMAITDTACFTDAVALTDTAPVTETAVLRPPA